MVVKICAWGTVSPRAPTVGGLNKNVLPSKLQYLLACDNIAKKLGVA